MDFGEDLFTVVFSLGGGVESFYFGFVCSKSMWFLLQVATCSDSYVSSFGSTKSHIPCNYANSSSSVVSSFVETSSSSPSDSTFDIVFGGLGLAGEFLLNGIKYFLEEVSATYFLISTISLDMVLRTFYKLSRSKGPFGGFFLDSSLKVTFLDFRSSDEFSLSTARMHFSIAISSFIFSAKVGLVALSSKIVVFEGRAEIYHSFWTSSLGLDVASILFNNLLKRELKSFIGSLGSTFKLERSLIRVTMDLSSPNLVKYCS